MPWRALEWPEGTGEVVKEGEDGIRLPRVGEGGEEASGEEVGKRGSTVWKEEGQGGGKDSPQVDTIAKSHQVQVSRCFYAPVGGRGKRRTRKGEKDMRGRERERGTVGKEEEKG